MRTIHEDPYEKPPLYETEHFIFRLVREEDAQDLLECYSDPASAGLFNSDNCSSNFIYHTMDEMSSCIRFWLDEYKSRYYIRFSCIDKTTTKAFGTLECFAKPEIFPGFGKIGVLRIDLASRYETIDIVGEILMMIANNFFNSFEIQGIITKSVLQAKQRIIALKSAGFQEIKNNRFTPYDDYFLLACPN